MLDIGSSVKNFFSKASLNVLLLQKILTDNEIPAEVISAVTDDLKGKVEETPLTEDMLTSVFRDHEIEGLAPSTYNELDSLAGRQYGSIACP